MSIRIRKASAADAEGVLSCLHIAFEPFRTFYSPQGFRDTTLDDEAIGRRMQEMTVLVAEDDSGIIVGTIAGTVLPGSGGVEGHIRGMAVLPEYAGSGVAQMLLNTVEDYLVAEGCERISLDTTAPLQRAIRFYKKNGYAETGKVGDHFGMPLYEFVKRVRD